MIRKSAFILILIVVVLGGGSIWLFSDSMVRSLTEMTLSKILKREVRVDGMTVRLSDMSVGFEKLHVLDPVDNTSELVTTGPAKFDLEGARLLAKKVVINEISLNDVVIKQRDEKQSSLSPRRENAPQSASSREEATEPDSGDGKETTEKEGSSIANLAKNLPDINVDSLSKKLNIDEYVHPSRLKSVLAIREAEREGKEKISHWNKVIETTHYDREIKQIQQEAIALRSTKVASVEDARKLERDWRQLKGKIAATKQRIYATHKSATEELRSISIRSQTIRSLSQQDYEGAKKLANLRDINASQVGKMIFGKNVVVRYQQVMGYLGTAREFFSGDEKPKVRGIGRTIDFPVTGVVYPAFMVKKMRVNGTFIGRERDSTLSWTGSVHDLTHRQNVSRKPTIFDITAVKPESGSRYSITGFFDYITDDYKNSVVIAGKKLKLADISLKKGGGIWPTRMRSDNADLTVKLELTGEEINGEITLLARSVRFTFENPQDGQLAVVIREMFDEFKRVRVKSSLKGRRSDPHFSVSSNIDAVISRRLNMLLGKKIKEAQREIKRRIDAEVNNAKTAAEAGLDRGRKGVLVKVNRYRAEIQKREKEANAQIAIQRTRIALAADKRRNELKKSMKREADKKKRELEKRAKERLKHLFK